jgi:hypothetical protein
MSRVTATAIVPGPLGDVEALWYDRSRWPAFVDGYAATVRADDAWPQEGSRLLWDSTPHGRGRVIEIVTAYEPRGGQSAEVEDERLVGTQRVQFISEGDAVRLILTLEYSLKDRNILTPIVDLFFVRRAVRDALRRTVARFRNERVADVELT